jgi:hypothetical protein
MRAVSCLTEKLLAFQESLCFMVLVLLAELHREYQFSLVGFILVIAGLETKQNFEFGFHLQNVSFISIKLLPDVL